MGKTYDKAMIYEAGRAHGYRPDGRPMYTEGCGHRHHSLPAAQGCAEVLGPEWRPCVRETGKLYRVYDLSMTA